MCDIVGADFGRSHVRAAVHTDVIAASTVAHTLQLPACL